MICKPTTTLLPSMDNSFDQHRITTNFQNSRMIPTITSAAFTARLLIYTWVGFAAFPTTISIFWRKRVTFTGSIKVNFVYYQVIDGLFYLKLWYFVQPPSMLAIFSKIILDRWNLNIQGFMRSFIRRRFNYLCKIVQVIKDSNHV
jgi:hypothetical protein